MPTSIPDTHDPIFTRSLEELRPELSNIPDGEVLPIRHDIENAVVLLLGVAPGVLAYREATRSELGEDAARPFDVLLTATRAMAAAHAAHRVALRGVDLEEMAGTIVQLRAVLSLEVQSLVNRRLVSAERLAELVGGTSYRAAAFDVLQLVSAFRAEWPTVGTKTPVTLDELDRAESLAHAFLTALGEKDADVSTTPSADLRRRAYTFLVRTYEEVRRAVTYVRYFEGDADDIAPSLSAGRARRTTDEEPVDDGAPVPGPVVEPGLPGAPALSEN